MPCKLFNKKISIWNSTIYSYKRNKINSNLYKMTPNKNRIREIRFWNKKFTFWNNKMLHCWYLFFKTFLLLRRTVWEKWLTQLTARRALSLFFKRKWIIWYQNKRDRLNCPMRSSWVRRKSSRSWDSIWSGDIYFWSFKCVNLISIIIIWECNK